MYHFSLQRHKPKLSCPSCGRPKCFTPYVDTATAQIVDPTCGICDHLNSCGYHLPPRQYFASHPGSRPAPVPDPLAPPPPPEPEQPIGTLPASLVVRSCSTQSTLCQWLRTRLPDPQAVCRVALRYRLGATRQAEVIYWQIDIHQQVRAGKIMAYTPDGHRCGHPSWVHTRLQNRGLLPGTWRLGQCLFGEHLLADNPDTVGLVESEKTALVLAALFPQVVWLATGGCKQLSAPKLAPLVGRRLVVLPDSGCYQSWRRQLAAVPGLTFAISPALESYPPNTDIADLI